MLSNSFVHITLVKYREFCMTAREIRICYLVLIVSLTRNLAKTKLFFFPNEQIMLCLLYMDVDGTSKNLMKQTSQVFIHFQHTEASGQIYRGQQRNRKYLNFNDNHLNERKDKERLLLLDKFQVSKEKLHDHNHDYINIF